MEYLDFEHSDPQGPDVHLAAIVRPLDHLVKSSQAPTPFRRGTPNDHMAPQGDTKCLLSYLRGHPVGSAYHGVPLAGLGQAGTEAEVCDLDPAVKTQQNIV